MNNARKIPNNPANIQKAGEYKKPATIRPTVTLENSSTPE
jgi:hypothetical protein